MTAMGRVATALEKYRTQLDFYRQGGHDRLPNSDLGITEYSGIRSVSAGCALTYSEYGWMPDHNHCAGPASCVDGVGAIVEVGHRGDQW
ncbi:hypothetical protein [Nocardia miyunensis]|uniref:hypothetical protein n=1 Tax=Nocardia miyunensis TaxID=282684 RepID=UPI0008338B41|nr:hypothetical protein [Nocardia miyunensis]